MRKLNEKRPELGGRFLRLTPPMSNELHVFWGGRIVCGRGATAMGATVEEGWFVPEGDPSPAGESIEVAGEVSGPLDVPLSSGGDLFGLVMVTADLATDRAAIALARAR
jgi:hypothetical protein